MTEYEKKMIEIMSEMVDQLLKIDRSLSDINWTNAEWGEALAINTSGISRNLYEIIENSKG